MKQLSKRILAYVLAAALLVTCGISGLVLPAAAATTVFTENFEGATTSSAIKNWTASGVGTVTADPTNAENKVLKFETAFTNKWSGGKFGLRPSKLYVLKLRAYGGDVVVNFNAGTSKGISAPVANKAYNQTAWQELAYLFETHATTANDAYSIKLNAAANTYIDDIELIELGDAEPENRLVDGSFDLPVSYEYNGYWKDLFAGGATLVDAPGEAGNKAVLLPASSGNRSSKYYGAAVYPAWEKGATYELSMRVYGAPVEFYLNADKGVTEGQGWHSFTPTDATSWQTFKHTFSFSESKASNDSFVFSIAIGKGSSGAYIDDICITKKVAEDATAITLNKTALSLAVGGEETLTVTPVPENGILQTVQWSSSNEAAATVDQTGKITAVAPGTATITATANDGSGVGAQCEVTVEAATYVSITVNQYGSGTYCSEYALDFSNVEGLKAYAATGYNKKTKVVTLTRVMTTQPGEGLFIKGESGTYMVPIIEEADDNSLNMLVGTLTDTPVNAQSTDGLYANYKYTIKADESEPSFHQFADGSTLSAGKAYLQIPVAWLPATTEARSISLRFEEGEGTTDIENSEIKNQKSEFVYDLYGRRVDNPVKGGIYIVGGKKKVVK